MEQIKQAANEPSEDTKIIIVILLLLFLYPAGIVMMWVWMKNWPKWLKILLTVPMLIVPFLLVLFIVGIILMVIIAGVNPSKQMELAKQAEANKQTQLEQLNSTMEQALTGEQSNTCSLICSKLAPLDKNTECINQCIKDGFMDEISQENIQYYIDANLSISKALQLSRQENADSDEIAKYIDEALNNSNTLVQMHPNSSIAWENKGGIYYFLIGSADNSDQFAIESFEKALSIKPERTNVYGYLGDIYYYQGDIQKAIDTYEQGLVYDQNNLALHTSLAKMYAELGTNPEKAEYHLLKTQELSAQ